MQLNPIILILLFPVVRASCPRELYKLNPQQLNHSRYAAKSNNSKTVNRFQVSCLLISSHFHRNKWAA